MDLRRLWPAMLLYQNLVCLLLQTNKTYQELLMLLLDLLLLKDYYQAYTQMFEELIYYPQANYLKLPWCSFTSLSTIFFICTRNMQCKHISPVRLFTSMFLTILYICIRNIFCKHISKLRIFTSMFLAILYVCTRNISCKIISIYWIFTSVFLTILYICTNNISCKIISPIRIFTSIFLTILYICTR